MLWGTPKNTSIAQRLILETFPLSNYFLFKNAPRKLFIIIIIVIIAFITSPFSFLLNMCQVHTSPSILLLTALSSSCIHYQFFNFVFLIYSSRDRQIFLQRSTNTFFCFTFLKEDCDRDELCLFWCFDMKRKHINKKVTKVKWLEFQNNNKSIWKSRWC